MHGAAEGRGGPFEGVQPGTGGGRAAGGRRAGARGAEQGVRDPGAGRARPALAVAVELVAGGAEQQRDVLSVHGQSLGERQWQDVVADDRAEHEQVVVPAQVEHTTLDQLRCAQGESGPGGWHVQALAEPCEEVADPGRFHREQAAGQTDRPLEPAAPGGRRQQGEHHRSPGRLARDGDPVRVAPERGDVLPHPVEREEHVPQPEVGGDVVQYGESVDAEPVADGDGDDAVAGEGAAVVPGARRAAREKAAAVDPHEHRAAVRVGGRDGDVQYVVARHRRFRDGGRGEQWHALCGGSGAGGVVRPREAPAWERRGEPPWAGGCFGKGDAQEPPHVPVSTADDRARRGPDGDRRAHRSPVPAMPWTKYRCRKRKSTSTGSITTIAPASSRP